MGQGKYGRVFSVADPADAEDRVPERARLLPAQPGDRVDDQRRHAPVVLGGGDEDDVVAAEGIRQALGALRRLVRLQILVEQRHLEIGEAEIGDLDAGFAELHRHVPAQDLVDRVLAQRATKRDRGARLSLFANVQVCTPVPPPTGL
jgi:hypothetical protein